MKHRHPGFVKYHTPTGKLKYRRRPMHRLKKKALGLFTRDDEIMFDTEGKSMIHSGIPDLPSDFPIYGDSTIRIRTDEDRYKDIRHPMSENAIQLDNVFDKTDLQNQSNNRDFINNLTKVLKKYDDDTEIFSHTGKYLGKVGNLLHQ